MEITKRKIDLIATIKEELPEFMEAVADDFEGNIIILHQDAFGADYQEEEYRLFGMAIKYAGLFGKEVRVIGKNSETLK